MGSAGNVSHWEEDQCNRQENAPRGGGGGGGGEEEGDQTSFGGVDALRLHLGGAISPLEWRKTLLLTQAQQEMARQV